jgi:hypothetical protein
MAKEKT